MLIAIARNYFRRKQGRGSGDDNDDVRIGVVSDARSRFRWKIPFVGGDTLDAAGRSVDDASRPLAGARRVGPRARQRPVGSSSGAA